jgi:predicted nucleic acid-binding protein
MKRVIDSSVAFKWVVPEQHSDKAVLLRDDFRNGLVELLSPDIFPVELSHALTRAERQNRIAVSDSVLHLNDVLTTLPDLHPALPLLLRATEISSQMRIGVYDCLYVALAEREGCDFVTADIRLINNLKNQFSFITDLASLP